MDINIICWSAMRMLYWWCVIVDKSESYSKQVLMLRNILDFRFLTSKV